MAIDFAHPLCYYKNGTHKIFGCTSKTDAPATTDFICAQTGGETHYFPLFSTAQTAGYYVPSSIKTYKNYSTLIAHSIAGSMFLSYEITSGSLGIRNWTLTGFTLPLTGYKQDIQITGTVTLGSSSSNLSVTMTAGSTSFSASGSVIGIGSVVFQFTVTVVGTNYTKSVRTTISGSSASEYITLTDSVNP